MSRSGKIFRGIALLAWAALLIVPGGCFRQRRSTTSMNEPGYVTFRGRGAGATFTVRSQSGDVYTNQEIGSGDRAFAVPPGAYEIVVERDGIAVVRRKMLLTEGQTLEVSVP